MQFKNIALFIFTILGDILLCQNNPIFLGGAGGNFGVDGFEQQSDSILFKGNTGDGMNSLSYSQNFITLQFQSTSGDSWSTMSDTSSDSNLHSMHGGIGDSWSQITDIQIADTFLFKSTNGDGWAANEDYQIADTFLFKSSVGDGWITKGDNQIADTSLFKSGMGDGWIAHIVDIPMVPLPLVLTKFYGEIVEKNDVLHWQTSSEVNTSHFIIEHSIDGIKFEILGNVRASIQSQEQLSYSFTNKNPVIGSNFYRLRMVDVDGTETLSNIVLLQRSSDNWHVVLYPNPTADVLKIQNIYPNKAQDIYLYIFDQSGKCISPKGIHLNETEFQYDMSSFPNGLYSFVFYQGNVRKSFRVVKVD